MEHTMIFLVPRFSNAKIWQNIRNWNGWKAIGEALKIKSFNFSGVFTYSLKSAYVFITELFANVGRIILHKKQGRHCYGSILFASTLLLLVTINLESLSSFVDMIKAVALGFWKVVSGLDVTWEYIFNLFWQPDSLVFTGLIAVYFLAGFIQLLARYFNAYMDVEAPYKKGTSLIYLLIRKRTKRITESFVEGYFEPSLFIVAGWICYGNTTETRFSVVLILIGVCLFWQELQDRNHRKTV